MSRRARDFSIAALVTALAALSTWMVGLPVAAIVTAATTGLCASLWILEPIPIPATSILPFALFPLTGVLTSTEVAAAYGHHLVLLLMGGFMLSAAIEKSGAHRRMALAMVRLTGGGGRRLVLGFMLASAVCSMWMSNTATTLMLLPVAIAVLGDQAPRSIQTALLLGIAYAASIGGIATPVGTPPNVIFMGIYQKTTGIEYSFLEWMTIGVPVVVVLIPLAWLLLTRNVRGTRAADIPVAARWSKAEVRVLFVFALVALGWVFRASPGGGWTGLVGEHVAGDAAGFAAGVSDSTVALFGVALMFFVPGDRGEPLLDWKTAASIPWGLLLLFGGGIALAEAFRASGLSAFIGDEVARVSALPTVVTVGIVCLAVTFLTEVTSNTATTNLLMPILAAAATSADIDPRVLMIPAAMSASCAFMLPVATAPNAVMYGTGRVSARDMAREGFWLNLVGAAAITIMVTLLL